MSSQETRLQTLSIMRLEAFYAELDGAIADDLKRTAEAVNGHKEMQVEIIVGIGRHLRRAKSLLNHGQFTKWLSEACGFTHRSANNYMHVADHFGEPRELESVSNLKFRTLYALASPSTPRETRLGILKTLRRNPQASDSSIMNVISTSKSEKKRQKLEAQFSHLSWPEKQAALSDHYAEQAATKDDKEQQVQLRLKALQRLYHTLVGSGVDMDQLVVDLEEAGIAHLPTMIAKRDEIPPGLRDADGNLFRELDANSPAA
jgi:hypothetical protein